MLSRARIALFFAIGSCAIAALVAACVSDDSVGPGGDAGGDQTVGDASNDGGADADAAPPAQGFTMSLAPAHVIVDPNDANIQITINVLRAVSFTDNVTFSIAPTAHVTVTTAPLDTGNGGTSSSFVISVDGSATVPSDLTLTVSGQNPSNTFHQNAPLAIHVGTLVDLSDGGFVVPSYASALVIKAWGGGGGGSAGCANCGFNETGSAGGGLGGAGGFTTATVPVTPGTNLVAVVATGGAGSPLCAGSYGGGGGGGFSGVQVKGGSWLVIAGGGGGASAAGQGGGCGGGPSAQAGVSGGSCAKICGGLGGSQTDGGAGGNAGTELGAEDGGNGVALQGGNATTSGSCTVAGGGAPGGGAGAFDPYVGGGGGGGGWFGGGAGAGGLLYATGGGGGGSGWFVGDGGTTVTGDASVPPNVADPDYAALCPTSAGHGGDAGTIFGPPNYPGGTGVGGCVIVRLAKP